MADYQVNYSINVNSASALASIQQFQEATKTMAELTSVYDTISKRVSKMKGIKITTSTGRSVAKLTTINNLLDQLQAKSVIKIALDGGTRADSPKTKLQEILTTVTGIQNGIASINKTAIKPKVTVGNALRSLNALLKKINQIESKSKIVITASAAGASGAVATTGAKPASTTKKSAVSSRIGRGNFLFPTTRQALGPTYATTGTSIAGEMVKGMGITYGLSSLFSGITGVFRDSTTYDNIAQTTKNILETHDKLPDFERRFNEMNWTMRQVGVDTKYTAPQVASAGKFLAMAGMNVDQIRQSIRPIANIALVGDTDLGETADVVTNIMTSYEIPAARMNNAADVLTMTFTKTNTTLMELAESFKYAGTVAHQSGLSFETASAAFGVLGDAGIKGSHAGTTLRMMLLNMMNPTKRGREAWAKLGVSTTDSEGNLRDLSDILYDLHQRQQTMGEGEFTRLINQMFRVTAAPGALALIANVNKMREVIGLNEDSYGLSAKLAKEKQNTVLGLWHQFTSAFTESGMQGFERMQNTIRDFLQELIALMKSEEFAKMLRDMLQMVTQFAKVVADIFKQIMWVWNMIPDGAKDLLVTFTKWQMIIGVTAKGAQMIMSTFIGIKSFMMGDWLKIMVLNPIVKAAEYAKKFYYWLRGSQVVVSATNSAAAGGAAATVAAEKTSWLDKVVTPWSIMTSPLGATILGTGALVIAQVSWHNLRNRVLEYADSLRIVNGISMSEHASATDKYLRIAYNGQLSLNEKVAEYIKLRREEIGLTASGINRDNQATFKEQFGNEYDLYHFSNWRKLSLGWGARDAMITASELARKAANMLPDGNPYKPTFTESVAGSGAYTASFLGHQYGTTVNDANRLNAAALLFTKGASTTDNSEALAIVNEFSSRFLKTTNEQQWQQVNRAFLDKVKELQSRVNTDYANLTMSELGSLTEAQWKTAPAYIQGLIGQIVSQLDWMNKTTANAIMLNNARALITGKGQPTATLLQELLMSMGVVAANPALGLMYGDAENNLWHHFGWDGSKFTGTASMEPQAANENVTAMYEQIKGLVNKFDASVRSKFDPIMNLPQWSAAGANTPAIPAGYKLNYVTGEMEPDPSANSTPGLNSFDSLYSGGDQSMYKSHYSDNTAKPKQVIVNIDSLMRVDNQNIDMNDNNKTTMLESLKQQLATMLLDVVQDFNANVI